MLNESIKQEFIKEYLRSRIVALTSLNGMFNKVKQFELKLSKDVSEFSIDEIIDMYKQFDLKSVNTLQNYNNYLKAYCAFRKYKGYETQNPFENITKTILKDCINEETKQNKYMTYEQLQDIEDGLYNAVDAAILECLWAGIAGPNLTDLTYLTHNQINKNNMTIVLKSGKVISLYPRLLNLLTKAFAETECVCYGETMKVKPVTGVGELYKVRDNVYKDSDEIRFRWVYRKVMIIRQYFDIPTMSMKTIQGSGMLNAIKIGMKENDVDLRGFLSTECGEKIMARYDFTSENRKIIVYDKFIEYV